MLQYLINIRSIMNRFQHIRNGFIFVLTTRDSDMPQCGFDDVEGAQVAWLQPVLLAEALPALSKNVAGIVGCGTTHLP